MIKLSKRVDAIKPSATLAVDAKAKALKEQGFDIINLSAGEPDFDTPAPIKEACIQALQEGFTKYTPTPGILSLRREICRRLEKDYGFKYQPDEVVVTSGAKQAIFNLILSLLDPGDEVLILAPYWVSYPEIVICGGGVPKVVKSSLERNFEPSPEDIEKGITPRTVGIILNSPSNPTGLIYSREFLRDVAEIVKKYSLWVISDDIYDRLRFDFSRPENILSVEPNLRDQVFIVNGVSKTYAMTGWRIGWAVGPREVISACSKVQGQSTSHATSFAQKGAERALQLEDEVIFPMIEAYARRAKLLCNMLREIPGLRFVEPQGAFYLFADFSSYYGKRTPEGKSVNSSLDMAEYLLESARVALVPGIAFGDDKFLRISYATSEENIKRACQRLKEALANLT